MRAADETAGVIVNGRYIRNPSAQNLSGLITSSGKIGGKRMSGQFMYVVDDGGNVIIGSTGRSENAASDSCWWCQPNSKGSWHR